MAGQPKVKFKVERQLTLKVRYLGETSYTSAYIKNVLNHITLPGAIFIAIVAVVPSIIFTFTGNSLVQAFGGTSILIMVGVALDTICQIESQLKTTNYENLLIK